MARKTMLSEKHVRKAVAADGDDTTLSRWVKVKAPRGDKSGPGFNKPKQRWLPGTRFDVSQSGRSVFYRKGVKAPDSHPLVSGHSNVKIGRDVRKGRLFRGYWIYTLTLEERATCPRSCFHWDTCYGNNMPFAKRTDHRDYPALIAALQRQLAEELRPRRISPRDPTGKRQRKGVLVRLHALGDFFSVAYVNFWEQMLDKYPNLAVFGYTAWKPWEPIGTAIVQAKAKHGRRFAIRWSDGFCDKDAAFPITFEKDCPPNAFVCPEQTGRTAACATCALCWETDKNVAFLEH